MYNISLVNLSPGCVINLGGATDPLPNVPYVSAGLPNLIKSGVNDSLRSTYFLEPSALYISCLNISIGLVSLPNIA